ncbi:MAG: hypothetical protein RL846_27420 [Deltaproteobacteria bacterium]
MGVEHPLQHFNHRWIWFYSSNDVSELDQRQRESPGTGSNVADLLRGTLNSRPKAPNNPQLNAWVPTKRHLVEFSE